MDGVAAASSDATVAPMRLAVLWTRWSGYMDAGVRTFRERYGSAVFVSARRPTSDAPFDATKFCSIEHRYEYSDGPEIANISNELDRFRPTTLLIASWSVPAYRALAWRYRGRCRRVLFMDNQWRRTLKQRIALLAAPFAIRPMYDAVLVPGVRQRAFARRLGFAESVIVEGGLSCDRDIHLVAGHKRLAGAASQRAFLYVGRLAHEKGVDLLADAYRLYCGRTKNPWPLHVCGEGPIGELLRSVPGVIMRGFVQPDHLPEMMAEASCFVLPSRREAWGLALHEAACAGLPLICSDACGAGDRFIERGANGLITRAGDAADLAEAMLRVSLLDGDTLNKMMAHSVHLGRLISPETWAEALHAAIKADAR